MEYCQAMHKFVSKCLTWTTFSLVIIVSFLMIQEMFVHNDIYVESSYVSKLDNISAHYNISKTSELRGVEDNRTFVEFTKNVSGEDIDKVRFSDNVSGINKGSDLSSSEFVNGTGLSSEFGNGTGSSDEISNGTGLSSEFGNGTGLSYELGNETGPNSREQERNVSNNSTKRENSSETDNQIRKRKISKKKSDSVISRRKRDIDETNIEKEIQGSEKKVFPPHQIYSNQLESTEEENKIIELWKNKRNRIIMDRQGVPLDKIESDMKRKHYSSKYGELQEESTGGGQFKSNSVWKSESDSADTDYIMRDLASLQEGKSENELVGK